MTLSDRILSASTDAEAREVLVALWNGSQTGAGYPQWDIYHGHDVTLAESTLQATWERYRATLDARAYLSAAEMMVPEGWLIVQLSDIGLAGGCMCALGNPGTSADIIEDTGARERWQALAAAIAKTREG